jgi:hypothetical protein
MTVSIIIETHREEYQQSPLFTGRDACADETRDRTPPSLVYISTVNYRNFPTRNWFIASEP